MKAIQITVDDDLLRRLDTDPEVQEVGRSAVFRRAVDIYLRERRRREISAGYRKAYGGDAGATDLEEWADEGVWPAP